MQRRHLQRVFVYLAVGTAALVVAVAVVAVRALAVSRQVSVEEARADLDALEDANALEALLYQKGFVAEYFLTRDPHWLDELRHAEPAVSAWLARAPADSPAARRILDELGREWREISSSRARAIAEFQAGDTDGASRALVTTQPRMEHLRDLSNELLRLRNAGARASLSHADRAFRGALVVLAIALAVAFLAVAAIAWLLGQRIARPLYELVLHAESAGAGARVEVKATDEIGALGQHVRRLATEIEASSTELATQRARLLQAEKLSALGEMAAAVAHEVLNPLCGIKAAMQLLATDDNGGDSVGETAAAVDAEIRRVESMARRLVSFARPLEPQIRPCPTEELFVRLRSATRAEATHVSMKMSSELDALEADPDLLLQILVNLTLNACQAMPDGGHVELRARRDGQWQVLEVCDDGPGLAPEIRGRLFTPFVTTRRDGHGLGLALSQNIALAHGGRLEARDNAPSPGTTFVLHLPARPTGMGTP